MSADTQGFDALTQPGWSSTGWWLGLDLGSRFTELPSPYDALDEYLACRLPEAGVRADHVVAHVLPPDEGCLQNRLGVSLRLFDAGGRVPVRPDVLGDLLGGSPAPRLAEASVSRRSGVCLRFPGQDALRGAMAVWRVTTATAIDAVLLGTVEAGVGDLVDVRTDVRPAFEGGRLVLHVVRAEGGRLVPVEVAPTAPIVPPIAATIGTVARRARF